MKAGIMQCDGCSNINNTQGRAMEEETVVTQALWELASEPNHSLKDDFPSKPVLNN